MTTEGRVRNGIYKRGLSYYICIKINGIRHRRSFGPDRRAAELALTELERQRAITRVTRDFSGLEKLLTPKSTKTFKEAAESYMAEKQLKYSSKLAYEDRLKHLLAEFGEMLISDITEEQIARYQARLRNNNKLSANRTNAIVNLLRSILKMCARRNLIETNPAAGVDRVRTEQTEVDPLTRDELELVLSKLAPAHRPIFVCLAWAGARPGELKALKWRDIDFVRNEIRINKARYRDEESTSKTRSSNRVIPMLPPVKQALEELKQSSTLLDIDGHVFVGKDGKPISRHLDRTWAVALQRARLRHRPSYQLRHTFASLCLQAGQNPGWVGKMLGHTNLQTTFQHYARFIPENQKTDQRITEALFGSDALDNGVGPQNGPQSSHMV